LKRTQRIKKAAADYQNIFLRSGHTGM